MFLRAFCVFVVNFYHGGTECTKIHGEMIKANSSWLTACGLRLSSDPIPAPPSFPSPKGRETKLRNMISTSAIKHFSILCLLGIIEVLMWKK